jgi:hypothetical protein
MKSLGRRGVLKAMAAAPVAGKAIAETMLGEAGRYVTLPGLKKGGAILGGQSPQGDGQVKRFRSFASWWEAFGKDRLEETAQHMGWDADILGLRLPLATLTRMQRERNRIKAKETLYRQFMYTFVRRGSVEEWL